jgi:riboflavin biosynthesis pyrimidine reductase
MTGTAITARPIERSDPPALEALWQAAEAPTEDARGAEMPPELEARYGGRLTVPLATDRPTVIANFVSTIDGVVALGPGEPTGGGPISGFNEPDRFVMGLLRSLADVVLIGAGTLRGSTAHRWTPAHVNPGSAASFARWRAQMGLAAEPTTIVVSATGDLPVNHPGLNDPSIPVLVATTPRGAQRLATASWEERGRRLRVETPGRGVELTGDEIVALLGRLEARLVLCEGGPHLIGQLAAADLIDELFLTVAPQIVGRAGGRLGLVEGVALPAASRPEALVSVHRSTDHLFLRYRRSRRPVQRSLQ